MAPIGIDMASRRYTANMSAMAAVALFFALAAVPGLAEAMQPVIPAALPVSQELEQGTYQERFIRRLSGESSTRIGTNSQRKEVPQSGTSASFQQSQELEQGTYQERFIRRLSGESPAGVGRKYLPAGDATLSATPASLPGSQEPEQGTYQERFIRRLAGESLPRARGPK